MVPNKHRHLHQNQTVSNANDNHQINDKNFAIKRRQTTDKLGLQVIKNGSHSEATLSFLIFVFK